MHLRISFSRGLTCSYKSTSTIKQSYMMRCLRTTSMILSVTIDYRLISKRTHDVRMHTSIHICLNQRTLGQSGLLKSSLLRCWLKLIAESRPQQMRANNKSGLLRRRARSLRQRIFSTSQAPLPEFFQNTSGNPIIRFLCLTITSTRLQALFRFKSALHFSLSTPIAARSRESLYPQRITPSFPLGHAIRLYFLSKRFAANTNPWAFTLKSI